MTQAKLLNKGDTVLTVNEHFLAIKRKNGEVDIFNLFFTDTDLFIEPIKAATIGYGAGFVQQKTDDGETTVYRF